MYPATWLAIEIISVILFLLAIGDAILRFNEQERLTRVFEIIGFVIYGIIFENIGVAVGIYHYSSERFFMAGTVPLEIPFLEAVIFYVGMLFVERTKLPDKIYPFFVGLFGMIMDAGIDPVAVSDQYLINGTLEGRWVWQNFYPEMFYGIPYFNFTGWFALMFYYSLIVVLGRRYLRSHDYKLKYGIFYIIIAIFLSDILIASPVTNLMLFGSPFPIYGRMLVELITLSIVTAIALILIAYYWPRVYVPFDKSTYIIWIISFTIHIYNITTAAAIGSPAIVPAIVFAMLTLVLFLFFSEFNPLIKQKE